jgi:hypothetical protein
MEGINLVVDRWSSVLTEQDWPMDLGLLRLATLYRVAQCYQPRGKLLSTASLSRPVLCSTVDILPSADFTTSTKEFAHAGGLTLRGK